MADDALCDALCAGLGALVLHVSWPRRSALERAADALEWAADHAAELDGDPRRVLVAGRDQAAVAASALALRADDHGWPPLVGQVLVVTRHARDRDAPRLQHARRCRGGTIVTPLRKPVLASPARGGPGHRARRRARRPGVPRAAVPPA